MAERDRALAACDRRHRLDRFVILFHPSRSQPEGAAKACPMASRATPGRCMAAASTTWSSIWWRRRECPTSSPGSNGRPIPPGSRASRCWSSSTTSAPTSTSSTRRAATSRRQADRSSASSASSPAGLPMTGCAARRSAARDRCWRWSASCSWSRWPIVFTHVFSGRGAFMQIGALIGTIMVANVLMVIIPGQRKMVAALIAGQAARPGLRRARQAALDPQQLPDPAGRVRDDQQPLSAVFRHPLQLADRRHRAG